MKTMKKCYIAFDQDRRNTQGTIVFFPIVLTDEGTEIGTLRLHKCTALWEAALNNQSKRTAGRQTPDQFEALRHVKARLKKQGLRLTGKNG